MNTYDRNPEKPYSPQEDVGQRAWFLEEARNLEGELGFSTSKFTTVPRQFFEEIGVDGPRINNADMVRLVEESNELGFRSVHGALTDHFARQLTPHLPALRAQVQPLNGDPIIVRPSPLDETGRTDLSFAGAYKGYMPMGKKSRDEHLLMGTAAMLAGRFTKYGNCYYDRHEIPGDRRVGAIYMEPFFNLGEETPLIHGTAYVADDHVRNEYLISPPSDRAQRDARLTVQRGGRLWHEHPDQHIEDSLDFTNRMSHLLGGLHEHFNIPLDVEYIVDSNGSLYVLQLRKISDRHLANWENAPLVDESDVMHRSAIVDTVGSIQGKVLDMRLSVDGININEFKDGIIVMNHEPSGAGMHSQAFFQLARRYNLRGMRVVVDHGTSRLRDHLQYALAEDPGIDFILQTTDPGITHKLRHSEYAQINSNGISADIQIW